MLAASAVWIAAAASCGDAGAAGSGAEALSAGGRVAFATKAHVCAVVAGGLQCWGAGRAGQLGDSLLPTRRSWPFRVPGLPGSVEAVAAGGSHTCARVQGRAWCWGDNNRRQSDGGEGTQRPLFRLAPTRVEGLPEPVTLLAAGSEHSCALAAGEVWCWGQNMAGEAGATPEPHCRGPHRARACDTASTRVGGLPGGVAALALGRRHSCALAEGRVFCWGDVARTQVGGASDAPARAAAVDGLPPDVAEIAAGFDHTCALADGAVYCWGVGDRGQLGRAAGRSGAPAAVAGLPAPVRAIAAGGDRSCAAAASGVLCWGEGEPTPTQRMEGGVARMAVGADVVCAVRPEGSVHCLGENDYGQLGNADAPQASARPVPVGPWDEGLLRDRDGDGRYTVVCLGDSNTEAMPGWPATWCEQLRSLLPPERWQVVNRGRGGATAVNAASIVPGVLQVRYAAENDRADAVILAFGTNDVLAGEATDAIVAAVLGHARLLVEDGAIVLAGLVPPLMPPTRPENAAVDALNAALREVFGADRVVDLAGAFGPDDYVDGLHLSAAGQARRAEAAARTLRRLTPAP